MTCIKPFVIITFTFNQINKNWRYNQIKIQIFAALNTRLLLNDNELRGIKDNSYISSLNNWVNAMKWKIYLRKYMEVQIIRLRIADTGTVPGVAPS